MDKKITYSLLLALGLTLTAVVLESADKDKRIEINTLKIEENEKVISSTEKTLVSIDQKLDVLISKFEYERGKHSK